MKKITYGEYRFEEGTLNEHHIEVTYEDGEPVQINVNTPRYMEGGSLPKEGFRGTVVITALGVFKRFVSELYKVVEGE